MQKVNIKTCLRDYKEHYTSEEISLLEDFSSSSENGGLFEFAIDDSYIMVAFQSDSSVNTRQLESYLYDNNDIAFEAYYEPQEVLIGN